MLSSIDRDPIWHPYTAYPYLGPPQVFWQKAQGSYVWDQDGKKYFDATSSWWCITHGHCHPRMVSALQTAASKLDQVLMAPHTHPSAHQLAVELLKLFKWDDGKVFYTDNGSTAVETSLKMLFQYSKLIGSKRNIVLKPEGSYHGDTLSLTALSGIFNKEGVIESNIFPISKALTPYCYRCPLQLEYPSCGIQCLDDTIKFLEEKGEEVLALLIEPAIFGALGMVAYPYPYLERLVRKAKENGVIIIFDEVFTGFGRTGPFFVSPSFVLDVDIILLSKGLTAGMLPLGAMVARKKFFEPFMGGEERKFYHGHTFFGNPLATTVALENVRIFAEEDVLTKNNNLIALLSSQVNRFKDLKPIGDVRHLGMIFALEFVSDKKTKKKMDIEKLWQFASTLWVEGLWVRPLSNIVYIIPPYSTTREQLEEVLSILYQGINEFF